MQLLTDPRMESLVAGIDHDIIKLNKQQISNLLKGHAKTMFEVAEQYYTLQDFEKALDWYKSAHQYYHPTASVNIGLIHYHGLGTVVDYNEAYSWFIMHLGNSNGMAECYLGIMYEEGLCVVKNMESATKWFEAAVSYGYTEAQYRLGMIYSNKLHEPHAKRFALKYLERAARKQHAGAIEAVKVVMGVEKDGTRLKRQGKKKMSKKEKKRERARLLRESTSASTPNNDTRQQAQLHKKPNRTERLQMRSMVRDRYLEIEEQTPQEQEYKRNLLKTKSTDEILDFIQSDVERRKYLNLVIKNEKLLEQIRSLEYKNEKDRELRMMNDDIYTMRLRISKLEGIFHQLGRSDSLINHQKKPGEYPGREEEDMDDQEERYLYENN